VRKVLRSGIQTIEILRWHECDPSDTFMEFRDSFSALSFLRNFMRDPFNMMTLRDALAESLPTINISRLTHDEILRQLAWQIVRGYVRLLPGIEKTQYDLRGAEPEAAEEAAEPEQEAPPVERAARTVEVPEQPVEVPEQVVQPVAQAQRAVVAPVVTVAAPAAQAGTLTQAAQSGAPFCGS
jgi:hypothetical protein